MFQLNFICQAAFQCDFDANGWIVEIEFDRVFMLSALLLVLPSHMHVLHYEIFLLASL